MRKHKEKSDTGLCIRLKNSGRLDIPYYCGIVSHPYFHGQWHGRGLRETICVAFWTYAEAAKKQKYMSILN